MLSSLTLLAAILSAAIAIPRPDEAGDPAPLTSSADAFMAQLPGADGNVLALAGSANPPAPVRTIYTDELALGGDGQGRARAMSCKAQSGKFGNARPSFLHTTPPNNDYNPDSMAPDDGSCFAAYEAWKEELLEGESSLKEHEKELDEREKELDKREAELEKRICLPQLGN